MVEISVVLPAPELLILESEAVITSVVRKKAPNPSTLSSQPQHHKFLNCVVLQS